MASASTVAISANRKERPNCGAYCGERLGVVRDAERGRGLPHRAAGHALVERGQQQRRHRGDEEQDQVEQTGQRAAGEPAAAARAVGLGRRPPRRRRRGDARARHAMLTTAGSSASRSTAPAGVRVLARRRARTCAAATRRAAPRHPATARHAGGEVLREDAPSSPRPGTSTRYSVLTPQNDTSMTVPGAEHVGAGRRRLRRR